MFDILIRFRLHPVTFTVDIKQAFLHILEDEDFRDVLLFFSIEDPSEETILPQICMFTRILFRINCRTFFLAITIKYELTKYIKKYQETVNFPCKNIYMDDVIGCRCSVFQYIRVC